MLGSFINCARALLVEGSGGGAPPQQTVAGRISSIQTGLGQAVTSPSQRCHGLPATCQVMVPRPDLLNPIDKTRQPDSKDSHVCLHAPRGAQQNGRMESETLHALCRKKNTATSLSPTSGMLVGFEVLEHLVDEGAL